MRHAVLSNPSRARRDERTAELLERLSHASGSESHALKDEIVLENRSMAVGLARQFNHRGVDLEDLIQVAMVGLVQAVERYRPGAGPAFSAYAVPTITGELKRYFRDHSWSVRPPRGLQELHRSVRDGREELEQELQREPTNEEIAALVDIDVSQVEKARVVDRQFRAASLDAPARRGSETPLSESVQLEADDPYESVVALISLRGAMARLAPREREILRMRFERNLTQRQIGVRLGVSQMQVSRLLHGITLKLRDWIDGPPSARGHERTA